MPGWAASVTEQALAVATTRAWASARICSGVATAAGGAGRLRVARLDDNRLDRWRETIVQTWGRVIAEGLPDPGEHRLYFDRGDETLDQFYAFFQSRIDAVVASQGWGPDRFRSLVFPGGEHNEASWNQRLDAPLTFLLPPA